MLVNEIYLAKSKKVLVAQGNAQTSKNVVVTLAKNLEGLGYTLSPSLIDRLQTLDLDQLTLVYSELTTALRKQVGAHKQYKPMYPNFPTQVMEASDAELYFNAIMHYCGSFIHDVTGVPVRIMPEYEKQERLPLLDEIKPKVIDLGSEDDFNAIFTRLVGSNSSISEADKEIVRWFVASLRDGVYRLLPASIPQKEQLALLAAELIDKTEDKGALLTKYVKTATDVLRIAVGLSGGDISLAEPTKFKKFKRAERKLLLSMLENAGDTTEDMLRHKNAWIKLGEILHPFEFKAKFPRSFASFDVLRNNKPFTTFNGAVELSIGAGDVPSALELLRTRPGDFARRLDHLFRLSGPEAPEVADEFLAVAHKVSTPVLLQVYGHFNGRTDSAGRPRVIFPKGSVSKVQVLENKLPKLSDNLTKQFAANVSDLLSDRFSKLPSLGKVYLDNKLANYPVPFSQRTASKALRTISRGSRIDLPEGGTVRFFLWWKDGNSRTDIDLSAVMFDEGWTNQQPISYWNLRNATRNAAHSGDITSAPNGAAEFIDIDIESFTKDNGRYVVMCVNSFTQQPYCDLPECFAGWMMRQHPKSGEVFEPKTVVDRVDLTANTTFAIPVVLDLVDRQVTWLDLALKNSSWLNNVRSNSNNIALVAEAMTALDKPTLWDLFMMHTRTRGTLVSDKSEADVVFSEHEGVTPYDIDKILSEYLA